LARGGSRGIVALVNEDEPGWTPSDIENIMLALMRISATLEEFRRLLGDDDDDEWEGSDT
jgi:hypothetical protein